MNEELVKYKTVKLALKKGIDFRNKEFSTCMTKGKAGIYHTYITQSLLQRWLREVHKIHITITSVSQESWMYRITKPGQKLTEGAYGEDFYTYEEALENGLQIALNLIK